MIEKRLKLNKIRSMVSLAAIVVGITVFALPGIVVAQDYEGSEFCQGCHEVNYSLWKVSGHPYKLMKSEEARNRPIPLPIGYSWDDISYVIGGYKWKSRYIDLEGYIITTTFDVDGNEVPGVNQYNNLVGYWSDYHAGEEDKPYNCGSCHTTNWVANEDPTDLTGNQDGLPGMWGTFDEGGIQCEQCHGNGMTMEIDDSAAFCGSCHFRTFPPGGEWHSRQRWFHSPPRAVQRTPGWPTRKLQMHHLPRSSRTGRMVHRDRMLSLPWRYRGILCPDNNV